MKKINISVREKRERMQKEREDREQQRKQWRKREERDYKLTTHTAHSTLNAVTIDQNNKTWGSYMIHIDQFTKHGVAI